MCGLKLRPPENTPYYIIYSLSTAGCWTGERNRVRSGKRLIIHTLQWWVRSRNGARLIRLRLCIRTKSTATSSTTFWTTSIWTWNGVRGPGTTTRRGSTRFADGCWRRVTCMRTLWKVSRTYVKRRSIGMR